MDKLTGQIVDKVEKLGIAENTIILYTDDNGTGKEITSMMGDVAVHGGKGTTTDMISQEKQKGLTGM